MVSGLIFPSFFFPLYFVIMVVEFSHSSVVYIIVVVLSWVYYLHYLHYNPGALYLVSFTSGPCGLVWGIAPVPSPCPWPFLFILFWGVLFWHLLVVACLLRFAVCGQHLAFTRLHSLDRLGHLYLSDLFLFLLLVRHVPSLCILYLSLLVGVLSLLFIHLVCRLSRGLLRFPLVGFSTCGLVRSLSLLLLVRFTGVYLLHYLLHWFLLVLGALFNLLYYPQLLAYGVHGTLVYLLWSMRTGLLSLYNNCSWGFFTLSCFTII